MDDRIKDAIQDIQSAIGYAYYQGFYDLRYDPVNILIKEIERLTSLIPQPVVENDQCICTIEVICSKPYVMGRTKTDPNCPQHGKCTCTPSQSGTYGEYAGHQLGWVSFSAPDSECPIHGGLTMILRNGK